MSGFEKRCYTNVHWVGKFVHTRCVREIYCTYTSGALLVGKENWLKRKRDHAHRGGRGEALLDALRTICSGGGHCVTGQCGVVEPEDALFFQLFLKLIKKGCFDVCI